MSNQDSTSRPAATPKFQRRPFVERISDDLLIVYVITVGHGCCKIGWTADIKDRLRKVSTHSPLAPKLRHCCVVPRVSAPAVERAAHAALADFRINGEWFAVKIDEAVAAVEQARISLGIPAYGERREFVRAMSPTLETTS